MANPEHLKILNQGARVWNEWRETNAGIRPDLSGVSLEGVQLYSGVPLTPDQPKDDTPSRIVGFQFFGVNLRGTNLCGAWIISANLTFADLSGANLKESHLLGIDFNRANLHNADFTTANISSLRFDSLDLSSVKGLQTVHHNGPSTINIDTLYKSAGKIPEVFLRGCGVPDDFITFIPAHFGIQQAIQFYSCFISYSTKDDEFARHLYSRMRDEKLRVWFATEDIKGGQKLHEQIERAIQLHDRLLIVLSEESMQSEWVITEIQRARKTEIEENRRKLFPISIVDFDRIRTWKCFDADTGKDLAKEVREYFIPDFSNWKDHDAFEKSFDRLLRDLKAEEKEGDKK